MVVFCAISCLAVDDIGNRNRAPRINYYKIVNASDWIRPPVCWLLLVVVVVDSDHTTLKTDGRNIGNFTLILAYRSRDRCENYLKKADCVHTTCTLIARVIL